MSPLALELLKIGGVFAVLHAVPAFLIWAERKVAADIQDRVGPNRVGPYGILQPLADGVKLLFKEDVIPRNVDRALYLLGPYMAYVPVVCAFIVVPFGRPVEIGGYTLALQVADLHVGAVFAFAIVAADVYGIAFGGWASRNKFSLIGGVRATSQMIAYEVAMGLALVALFITTGSVRMSEIVGQQGGWLDLGLVRLPAWNVFLQPVGAVLFLVAMFAEAHRLPFDLPEAEAELVGGYHTEYSSMKFALFFLGEYLAIIVFSSLAVSLYLGGWQLPFALPEALPWRVILGLLAVGVLAEGKRRALRGRGEHGLLWAWVLTVGMGLAAAVVSARLMGESLIAFEVPALLFLVTIVAIVSYLPARLVAIAALGSVILCPLLLLGPGPASVLAFVVKTGLLIYLFIWVRWTFPRFRFDTLLDLGWRMLIPLGMLNLLATAVVVHLLG